MKFRRHHNNDGRKGIKAGSPHEQMKRLAAKLKIPYGNKEGDLPQPWDLQTKLFHPELGEGVIAGIMAEPFQPCVFTVHLCKGGKLAGNGQQSELEATGWRVMEESDLPSQ